MRPNTSTQVLNLTSLLWIAEVKPVAGEQHENIFTGVICLLCGNPLSCNLQWRQTHAFQPSTPPNPEPAENRWLGLVLVVLFSLVASLTHRLADLAAVQLLSLPTAAPGFCGA